MWFQATGLAVKPCHCPILVVFRVFSQFRHLIGSFYTGNDITRVVSDVTRAVSKGVSPSIDTLPLWE